LNRAVAEGEVQGPKAALAIVDGLSLDGYRYLHATREELLRRLEPERAQLCRNAITMPSVMVDEIRLRAHVRPLDEALSEADLACSCSGNHPALAVPRFTCASEAPVSVVEQDARSRASPGVTAPGARGAFAAPGDFA
jgi:hypothetical protein